jgi:cytidylate kinase
MNTQARFEKCMSFINSEWQPSRAMMALAVEREPKLMVTISRQTGCGAHVVGEKLAEFLQTHGPNTGSPWTVFDRNIVEKVLDDHNLPRRLARFMPEDRISGITDTIDDLFGLHPPFWTLVHKTAITILRLAEQGNVVLIGRGANIITSKLDHAFHVRLVGSLERRVEHIQQVQGVGKEAALKFICEEDRGRQRYFKRYFGKDLDDPLLYHLVLNTDIVSYEETARIIGEVALHHLQRKTAEPSKEHGPVRHAVAFP